PVGAGRGGRVLGRVLPVGLGGPGRRRFGRLVDRALPVRLAHPPGSPTAACPAGSSGVSPSSGGLPRPNRAASPSTRWWARRLPNSTMPSGWRADLVAPRPDRADPPPAE